MNSHKIQVTVWNEFIHERIPGPPGDHIRKIYPDGIHRHLAAALADPGCILTPVSLDQPSQGLPDALLNQTDVLFWWGHCAHEEVADELVERIACRVQQGMGLIVLHSGHRSKIFRRLLGTECRLRWREAGEKERLWVAAPGHPIVRGVPESFTLPHTEMYGEPFDIPDDGKPVFFSWYEGGNVFRSGVTFQRGAGKIFYFSPGHETYPIYHDENVLTVLRNALFWAAPAEMLPARTTHQPEPPEPIHTSNPLAAVNTAALHASPSESKEKEL